ncbi:MAG: YidC/Oxa1 family membrane protein insertase [Dehalococcoidia bacterium]
MIEVWNTIILEPVMNCLIALSSILADNFGVAIIVLTVIVRAALYPLTLRQTRSTKAMQSLQPKIQELQKKYGRNQQKLQQELMKLYKEAGINPLGCMWPMLVQFPIWIALYQSIIRALAATPENLLDLSNHLYEWTVVTQAIPLNEQFLWLHLSRPDSTFVLAVLVGGTMWIQQKMITAPPTDPKQQSMTQMTTLMMPLMFGFLTLSFPSGLALYWVVSNLIGIVMQYYATGGWGYLKFTPTVKKPPSSPKVPAAEQQSKVVSKAYEKEKKKGLFRK